MDWISLLGFAGATFTTAAFIPQAIKILKTKSTKEVSLFMYIINVLGIIFWLIYGIARSDYPIIYANVISITLASTILICKIKYK